MLMLLELMLYRAFFPTFKVVYFAAANAKSGRWIGTELTTIVWSASALIPIWHGCVEDQPQLRLIEGTSFGKSHEHSITMGNTTNEHSEIFIIIKCLIWLYFKPHSTSQPLYLKPPSTFRPLHFKFKTPYYFPTSVFKAPITSQPLYFEKPLPLPDFYSPFHFSASIFKIRFTSWPLYLSPLPFPNLYI